MNKTFITGTDKTFQHYLPWWVKNIRRHDKETHITIADFGMDEEWLKWSKDNINHVIQYPKHEKCSWFWKPQTLLDAPYEYKCWIDIDCEVLTNITKIFDYADNSQLAITDDPYRTKEVAGEKWLATGVNVTKGKQPLIKEWVNHSKDTWLRGDQEVLHDILKNKPNYRKNIIEMDPTYQWYRIALARGIDHPDKKIIHWTGEHGKKHIESLLFTNG
jgi:hypothetical protein